MPKGKDVRKGAASAVPYGPIFNLKFNKAERLW